MNRYFIFFTPHYATMARECLASFKAHGVQAFPIEMPHHPGGWMKACMARSKVLARYASDEYPDDGIGLLDADLTCLKDPVWLKQFSIAAGETRRLSVDWGLHGSPDAGYCGGVAVHDLTDVGRLPDHRAQRYSAGVTCFAPSPLGRACLKRWAELCELDPEPTHELREQVYLYTAIEEGSKNGLTVFNLGAKYNRPIDEMRDGDDTVILHHVASRKLRDVIGGGL